MIFTEENIPACEICQVQPCEPKLRKFPESTEIQIVGHLKRCTYCKERFDMKGEPFIIYCDTLKFEKLIDKRVKVAWIWSLDGYVWKMPAGVDISLGEHKWRAVELMEQSGYELIYSNKSVG